MRGSPSRAGNVVAGPYVYSLIFGMSVPDVSGKAIANLARPTSSASGAGLPRRHPVHRERGARGAAIGIEAGPRLLARVHTRAYNQDGTLVAEFKRAVLVPRKQNVRSPKPEADVD